MAEEKSPPAEAEQPAPTPKKSQRRTPRPSGEEKPSETPAPTKAERKEPVHPKAPRRPTLDPEGRRLMSVRRTLESKRPKFVRTASHRYWRIGRWGSWRRPRGLQSKQRRHYGYRPRVVRIGYGGPRATRGRTPTGFQPILVRTEKDLLEFDPARDAALIARTVGTKRRLVLEEACRRKGIHILNPIVQEREET